MENPATWGPAEKIVDKILGDIVVNRAKPIEEKIIGLSAAKQITDALRNAGLLKEEEHEDPDHRVTGLEKPEGDLVCRLLLEKKKKQPRPVTKLHHPSPAT